MIGLGSMGMGAALNLHRKGHLTVTGCEPREAAREEFAAAQGSSVGSADQLPDDLEAVVVFVINAAQTEDVLFGPHGCLAGLNKGAVILCCSTVSPDVARSLGKRIEGAGFLMLDSPVSGGKSGALAGTMTVMGSGSEAAFAKAEPVLQAISTKIWRLGSEIGVGSTVKMVNQLLAGVHIATAAEALALGIRAGADPKTLFEVISGVLAGSSWMWQNRVPHILAGARFCHPRRSTSSSRISASCWDRRRAALTFPLPMASAAHQLFLAAAAHGEGYKDDSFRDPGVGSADRHRTAERLRPAFMLAVRCHAWMPYDQLQIEDDTADTTPGSRRDQGQGSLRGRARSPPVLSHRGTLHINGNHRSAFSPASTEIMRRGRFDSDGRPTRFKPGDRGLRLSIDWGGHAEYAITHESTAYVLPDDMPFDIAPSLLYDVLRHIISAALAHRAQSAERAKRFWCMVRRARLDWPPSSSARRSARRSWRPRRPRRKTRPGAGTRRGPHRHFSIRGGVG